MVSVEIANRKRLNMNAAVEYNTRLFELYIQSYGWFECLVGSAIERDSGGWGVSDTQSLLPGISLLFRSVVFVVFQKQGSFYTKTTC
jgi:hypothetical protein